MGHKQTNQQRTSSPIRQSTAKNIRCSQVRPPGYQLQRTIGNSAASRLLCKSGIQTKLTISDPGDAFEREADRVAVEVMRMPKPQLGADIQRSAASIHRKCTKCENQDSPRAPEEEKILQAKPADHSSASGASGVESYLSTVNRSGRPLPPSAREYFEPRFGRDLSDVRVHTDGRAPTVANSIAARAFTSGHNIVFGSGQYDPHSHQGKTLLAHELTHVVQQCGSSGGAVQRDPLDDLKKEAEELVKQQLVGLANQPAGPASGYKGDPKCGTKFCQPFVSKSFAISQLAWAGPLILAGIAAKVNPRVVPFWAAYLSGGSGPLDITSTFGTDFTNSKTTAATSKFLVDELKKDILKNPVGLPTAPGTVVQDFTPRLAGALARIDDPKEKVPPQMNFNVIADIAGNIAGGIGKDETKFPIGATPSPFNDSRKATIAATLTRNVDGTLTVAPDIKFQVKDTIDLCPGDCGASAEQVATIPLSRFEATGIAGDVPLILDFDAPAKEQTPFVIPAPPKKPVNGNVTASVLRIRAAPDDTSAKFGSYSRGTTIKLLCQTKGAMIDGNDTWFKTDKGFVSGRYVKVTGSSIPDKC